jgi:MarR family transcriptional regulator, 2-MHQ and catechol-resistance regulon repressor
MKPLQRFGIELGEENCREAVIYGLACVYLHIDKEISDYLRPFGLTPAKFNALMVIKHQGKDKGLSQVDISKSLIVTASNITRLLDKLADEEYIEKKNREGDRRVHVIRISKKGSVLLDKVWPGYHQRIIELASRINKEELFRTCGLLLKWAGTFNA